MIVTRHEVGLGIDLDHRALLRRNKHTDESLGGNATGLLGGLRQPLLAQPVLRRLHVSISLRERGLAVHHARAGGLAQVLDHRRGDICHVRYSLKFVMPGFVLGIPLRRTPSCVSYRNSRRSGRLRARLGRAMPGRDGENSYSATSSFALAIQPATRVGSPTSSPIFSASAALSSASCE